MNHVISLLLEEAQCGNEDVFDKALSDLRFLIERETMNRHGAEDRKEYEQLFFKKELIEYSISQREIDLIKYFLIYLLLNFPDRSLLTAKCLKVFFDQSIEEAICSAIEIYMDKDDSTTCELIYAIVNAYQDQSYLSNDRVRTLFNKIREFGKKHSKEIIEAEFAL